MTFKPGHKYIHFNSFVDIDRKGLRRLKHYANGRHASHVKFALADVNGKTYTLIPYTTMSDIDQWAGILIVGGVELVSMDIIDIYTDVDTAIKVMNGLQAIRIKNQ